MKATMMRLIVGAGALMLAESVSAGGYEVIDLGTLGGASSFAYAVNNAGQIVGDADTIDGAYRATLFDPSGSGHNLELGVPGGASSWAYAVNDAGQIVGGTYTPSWDCYAVLFDPSGGAGYVNLGSLGGANSGAYAVNSAGQIVGWAMTSGGAYRATQFDPSGGGHNLDLGSLGGANSGAYAVNSAGQIVGWADTADGARATLFDPSSGGHNLDLGSLGDLRSEAVAINEIGQIVGWARTSGFGYRATRFDPSGGGANVDLGGLGTDSGAPGSTRSWSFARGVNNAGQIVGNARRANVQPSGARPVLFDPSGGGNNLDLTRLVPACSGLANPDPSGQYGWANYVTGYADDINDDGWIVGGASIDGGNYRAFLLKPADAPPITLTVEYHALAYAAVKETLWGYTHAETVENDNASAWAHAENSVEIEVPGTPEEPWQTEWIEASAYSAVEFYSHDGASLDLLSDITFSPPYYGLFEPSGHTQLEAMIHVGTSAALPAGTALPLLAQANLVCDADADQWLVKIWRDGDLLGTLDPLNLELNLSVVAGETLRVEQYHGFTLETYAGEISRLGLTFTPTPEPGTLALLALGGLAVLSRRRR